MTGSGWDPATTHLPVPGTSNLRDLGGTPTGDGRVVRHGRLYRAETLAEPGAGDRFAVRDPAAAAAYRALGVATVLDLRSSAESARVPSAWPAATGATYVAVPVEEGGEGDTDFVRQIREGLRTRFGAADMAEYYGMTLQRRAGEFATAVRLVADPERTPVLVHCAAGKDRTGLLVALVLEALGVTRDDVVAEYALTGVLRPNRVAVYASMLAESGVEPAAVAALFDAPAEAMADALHTLDERYGSVVEYLTREGGLASADLEALRTTLLAASP